MYTPSSPLLAKISPQAACRPPAGKQRVCKAGGSVAGQALGTRGTTCPSAPRERADLGHVPAGRLGSQPATPGFSRQVAASTSGTWSGFRNHTSAAVEPESPSHSRLTPSVPLRGHGASMMGAAGGIPSVGRHRRPHHLPDPPPGTLS